MGLYLLIVDVTCVKSLRSSYGVVSPDLKRPADKVYSLKWQVDLDAPTVGPQGSLGPLWSWARTGGLPVTVVHLGRSTCRAISGRGDWSTRISDALNLPSTPPVASLQGLLANKDTHRPQGGLMSLGSALP